MADLLAQIKALGDPSRLRIVRCLGVEPLHVSEILDSLRMGQSRVSRHLRILADAGILSSSRDGSRIYYGLNPAFQSSPLGVLLGGLEESASAQLREDLAGDRERLQSLLESRRYRSLAHFRDFGARQDEDQRAYVDGDFYRQRIVSLLPAHPGVVLEPGCGAGFLSAVLSERAERLILVDQSRAMLELARERAVKAEFRIGVLQQLPAADEEADTVVISMVLHHIPEPRQALREAWRALKPGGVLVIAELDQHNEENMRRLFDDFWLGFSPLRLAQELEEAGFADITESDGKGAGRLNCIFAMARRPANEEEHKAMAASGSPSAEQPKGLGHH